MKTAGIEEMKNFLRVNNLTHLARELVAGGYDTEEAGEWVYDSHTLEKEDFRKKHVA